MLPPAPEHDNVNVVDADRLVMVSEPLVALSPLQPFDAVHESVLTDCQSKVTGSPFAAVAEDDVSTTVGAVVTGP